MKEIEKRLHHFVGRLVEAPSKRPVCHDPGQRIGRERLGTTAKHVPRKLVKQIHPQRKMGAHGRGSGSSSVFTREERH
jgi:hypothetical protein